jgi:Dimerisation domain
MSELQPSQQLVQMIVGSWVSRAIYVAAKLRVADRLAAGPRAAKELAAAAGVAPGPLYRLLRALAGVGVFARDADGRFHLNPLAEPLREVGPESLRALAVMLGEEQDRCWDDLFETVRTGETAFDRLYGRPLFDYLGEHPEQAKIFDAAMTGLAAGPCRRCSMPTTCRASGPWPTSAAASARTWPPPSAATRRCGACCSTSRTLSNGPARG